MLEHCRGINDEDDDEVMHFMCPYYSPWLIEVTLLLMKAEHFVPYVCVVCELGMVVWFISVL